MLEILMYKVLSASSSVAAVWKEKKVFVTEDDGVLSERTY